MTPTLSVIKPFAATNYVINPSFEPWSAGVPVGWTTYGSPTLTQSSTYPTTWRGAYSCEIVGASGYRGVFQDIALTPGQSYRCSVYIYMVAGIAVMYAYDYGNTSNGIVAVSSGAYWQRLSLTKVAAVGTGGSGLRLAIYTNNAAATFYVDCVQVEDGIETTTYIDGYEPGCYWNGAPNISSSTRSDQTREGGKIVNLVGSSYLANITNMPGVGMPPFKNVSMPFGLVGGSIHQRTVKQARVFTVLGTITGTGPSNFHTKRHAIEDLFKYDLVTPEQPVKLLYNDGVDATTLTIHAVYDGGLEFNQSQDAPFGYFEPVAIRFLADDPCWYDDRMSAQVLGYSQTVANANYILQRKAGVWSALNYGCDNTVKSLSWGPDGNLYVGGVFLNCGNVAAGDLATNGIAKWNGTTWSALGTGVTGGVAPGVYALIFSSDGSLYVGGDFTSANGVSYTAYVAKWNGSTFVAMGRGADAGVKAFAFGPDGSLYVGGVFTHMHDGAGSNVANTAYIAKWNGAAWSALGTGMDAAVYSLAMGSDGILYAGGNFANAGGVACASIAKWNGTAWSPLSSGMNSTVYGLCFGLDGILYAGGTFSTAGGLSCANTAKWNGTSWSPLGTGLNSDIYSLATNPFTGNVYMGGAFTTMGGHIFPQSNVIWNGTTWLPMDVVEPGGATNQATLFNPRGNIYIGFNGNGSATSATVTIPANTSTKSYPWIWITGPGTIYQVINDTTGRSIYFNNLTLQAGEGCILGLVPGNVFFWSNWRGNMANYILSGSNLDFYLQPGNNNISAYLVGGSAASLVWMTWNNTYWSADGVA